LAQSAFPAIGSTNRNFIPTAFLSPATDLQMWGVVAVYGWARPDAFSGYSTSVIVDPSGTNFFTIFKGVGFSLELNPGLVNSVDDQTAFLNSYKPATGVELLGGTVPAIRWNVEANGFDYTAFIAETLGMINQVLVANGLAVLPSLDAPVAAPAA
jgi:hypothetical protein